MEALGARRRNIKVAYAGGAQVFKFGNNGQEKLQVGARNIEKVKEVCKALGLDPLAIDVGGTGGRTMTFDSVSGVVTVRGLNVKEFELSNLRTAVRKVA
jgi:chemotaxis protein CheD